MEEYLIDRSTLEGIVDGVMSTMDLSGVSDDRKAALRESGIKKLDHNLALAVVCQLDDSQLSEYEEMLNDNTLSEEDFANFFANNNIDVQEVMKNEIMSFKDEFTAEVHDEQ